MKILLQDSEVTLFSGGPMLPALPPSGDTIRGTHVELEGSAEILAKKLAGRMLDTPRQLLERDLYDFAVADRLDPEAAKTAMRAIDASDLRQLHAELKNLPRGWGDRAKQRRLIRPAHREEAADPARFAAGVVGARFFLELPPPDRTAPFRLGPLNLRHRRTMPDIAKIRRFYFDPPPAHLERAPSPEELYAREEHRAVERCLRSGGDPREDALGEHGSLIGGPGKPLRRFTWDPEFAPGSRTPLPLAWFDHPRTRSTPDPPPSADEVRIFFGHLAGGHLAGYPERPGGAELARIFRSPRMTSVERDQVWHVFACIHLWDLPGLLYPGGMSVYEVARAIHLSGTLRPHAIAWINLFGAPPGEHDAPA